MARLFSSAVVLVATSIGGSGESRNPETYASLVCSFLCREARLDSGLRRNDWGEQEDRLHHYFKISRQEPERTSAFKTGLP